MSATTQGMSLQHFLNRGFVDLSETGIGSVQALNPQAAYAHAASGADYILPIQYNPSGMVRERILRELGERDYICQDPSAVKSAVRTRQWSQFVAWCADLEDLTQAGQRNVIILSETLGLYRLTAQLGQRGLRRLGSASTRPDSDFSDWLSGVVLLARYKDTGTVTVRRQLLVSRAAAAHSERLDLEQRLSAALFLVVAYSKSKPGDPVQAKYWRERAADLYAHFRPDAHWTKLALASSYWRGISFVPFHDGLQQQVTDELSRAEEFALAMPAGSFIEDVTRRQQLHPLYETRIREAIWRGDLELAAARAEELIKVDPLEPKVYITAGDVALRRNDTERAVSYYMQAAVLGPPYTVLARYKLGSALRDSGNVSAALTAFAQGLAAEPWAVTCAAEMVPLARECDDIPSMLWANRLASAARRSGTANER
jgi:tetratricopeptide (TPR) repeat protein